MIKIKNVWSYVAPAGMLFTVVTYMYTASMLSSSYLFTNEQQKGIASIVLAIALLTFILCVIAIFKTKRFSRGLAIFSCLISLIILGLTFFAYSFMGYDS